MFNSDTLGRKKQYFWESFLLIAYTYTLKQRLNRN